MEIRCNNQESPAISKKVFGAKMVNSFVIRDIPAGRNPTPKPSKDDWQMPGAPKARKDSVTDTLIDEFDPGLTDKYVKHISGKDNLSNVTDLELVVDTRERAIEHLGDMCPNLTTLKMSNSTLSSFRDLGTSLRNLKTLWLSCSGVVDLDGIGALVGLQELYLASNSISDLAPLAMHDCLQVLDLGNNHIDDSNQIGQLGTCLDLVSLTLEGNPMCRFQAYRRIVVHYIPELQSLDGAEVGSADHVEVTPQQLAQTIENYAKPRPPSRAPAGNMEVESEQTVVAGGAKVAPPTQPALRRPSGPPRPDITRPNGPPRPGSMKPIREGAPAGGRPGNSGGRRLVAASKPANKIAPLESNVSDASKALLGTSGFLNGTDGGSALTHGTDVVFAGNLMKSLRSHKTSDASRKGDEPRLSILTTLDQAKEMMLEQQRHQQPVLSLASSRPLLEGVNPQQNSLSTANKNDIGSVDLSAAWKLEKAASELASETWNPERRMQMDERMKERRKEQAREGAIKGASGLLSRPGTSGSASAWEEDACDERSQAPSAPSAPGGSRKAKTALSMPCPTVDVLSSAVKTHPSASEQHRRAPRIATRMHGCRRGVGSDEDSDADGSDSDSEQDEVLDRRSLKAASSRADLGNKSNRFTDSTKKTTPQSDRKGKSATQSALPFNLDEGLAAIEKWNADVDAAGGFHAVSITHAHKITQDFCSSKSGASPGNSMGGDSSSTQFAASSTPNRRGSRPVPGMGARPVTGAAAARAHAARAEGSRDDASGPESTSPSHSSPSGSPTSSQEDGDNDGEREGECLLRTRVSRSPRHLRKLCETAGSRDELESTRAQYNVDGMNSDDEEGEANLRTDEELIELLRKKPKHVPEMKTKDSFRQFFSCMKRERLQHLLATAYNDLELAEQNKKVKKRMELMEGWVR